MRLGGFLFLFVLVLANPPAMFADNISPSDPRIIIGTDGSTPITALQFGVPVNPTGGGIFDFVNETGQKWTGLILTVTFPNAVEAMAAGVSCTNGDISSDIFASCNSDRHGKILTITLTIGEIAACLSSSCPPDSSFFVDLNTVDTLKSHGNPHGEGGWKSDSIAVQAIVAPEPGTFALLLIGLCGISWLGRKFD